MNLAALRNVPWWGWVIAVAGAGALVYYVVRRQGSGAAASASTSAQGAAVPSEIDPYTGVPYSIEGATNPATGLPAYYGSGLGYTGTGDTLGSTIGTTPGQVNLPPVQTTQPPTQPPTLSPPRFLGPPQTPPSTAPIPPVGPEPGPLPTPAPAPTPTPAPAPAPAPAPVPARKSVTVTTWPQADSSLWTIWQDHGGGTSWQSWEQQVLAMNPQIANPDLLYPNERVYIP